jgi:hypothetical protein
MPDRRGRGSDEDAALPEGLGNRPIVDALVPLMDRMEAKERSVDAAAMALDRAAQADIAAGRYENAAALLRAAIEIYRGAHVMPYRIPEYEKRLADCLSLQQIKQRRKPRGKR